MTDKFLIQTELFKENSKTRYDGKKILQNLANLGGNKGTKLFVDRNGEYNGIVIELQDKVYPLFLDGVVHLLYLNIESNYTNNMFLIEKYGLIELYQKYSNEIFRYIVDQFLILNNSKPIFSDYPNIISQIEKDLNLINLKKRIGTEIHSLIPVSIKVISCGELLPEEWIGKVFDNAESFHRSIDMLEARINKPPVTYLANYCMMYFKEDELLNTSELKLDWVTSGSNGNVWFQDKKTGKFINLTLTNIKNIINTINELENYVTIDCFEKPIYVLFSQNDTFNQVNKELESNSIGFNVSLMQKSFRRGPDMFTNLKNAIEKLSLAKPYNNPELQYQLVSGSRQLFWRYFICVIEDIQIYESDIHLDICDLIFYSYIFSKYPKFTLSKNLTNKLVELGKKLLYVKTFVDFQKFKEDTTNLSDIKSRFELCLGIANKIMPGMRGDKKMIRYLLTWIKSKPKLINLDNIKTNILDLDNVEKISQKYCYYASIDLHTNPLMIVQLQNSLFGFKKSKLETVDLETCSGLIWDCSSKYNIRKHEKFNYHKLNDLLYLIQFTWFNNKIDTMINELNNSKYKNCQDNTINYELFDLETLDLRLKDNLSRLINLTINNEIAFDILNKNKQQINQLKHIITKNQICQVILSSQFKNNYWYKGKKIQPIYTNDQIKFKLKEEIIDSEDEQYEAIFNNYLTYLPNYKPIIDNIVFKINIYYDKSNEKIIMINNVSTIKIKQNYQIEYLDSTYDLIKDKPMYSIKLNINNILYKTLDNLITCNLDQISSFIEYKSIINLQVNQNTYIQSDLMEKIPTHIKQILLSRVLTSLEDKQERVTLIIGCIDRLGKANGDSVDSVYEGYILRLFNIFSVLYGCFTRVNEYKFIIDTKSKIFRHWLESMGYQLEFNSKQNKKIEIESDNSNVNSQIKMIKTQLWEHQIKVRDMVINNVLKFNQRGFGDASEVGSGKTLTALSCIEFLNNLTPGSNYLVLVPNTNLYSVWEDEIKAHCINTICKKQESDGSWIKTIATKLSIDLKKIPTIWLSTMGRNRDHQLNEPINWVVIDECLTVQNKDSKWTIKAFEQIVRAKYGVLMLSATFFRTRFDKLFFMLKMLCTGLPTKSEYLDTILNTAIGANIKTNRIKWETTVHKIELDKKFYLEYESNKVQDKFESYIKLKKYLNNKIKYEDLVKDKIDLMLKSGRKVLVYVESESQFEIFQEYVDKNKLKWGFYPDIEKDVCIISKHKGTYGINNLVKYDTIMMKPPEPDKLPQIKGRLDRPGQKSTKLYLEYIVIKNTIEEIDMIKLEISNSFYKGHIIPLANYYEKYC